MAYGSQNTARSYDYARPVYAEREHRRSRVSHREEIRINKGSIDYTALLIVMLLVLFGVVMVFSAGYYNAMTKAVFQYDMFYLSKKQAPFAASGFGLMLLVSNIHYKFWQRFSWLAYFATNALLVVVLATSVVIKGAQRWLFNIPIIGNFQPSELAKASIIFLLACIFHKNKDILKRWPGFLLCCGLVGISVTLVGLGNMSTAIILALIGFGVIFANSTHILRFIVLGAGAAGGLAAYLFVFAQNFRSDRVEGWLAPFDDPIGKGWQVVQSLYAIGSGGLFGLGIGNSRQKAFVPEPHNDYIFSIICEELGIFGAGLVIFLFIVLVWRIIKIANNAPDNFGAVIANGIALFIGGQAFINIAVTTNTIPSTGVPLPFISYGGTSLIVTMFLMGVLLNISRHSAVKQGVGL